MYCVFSTIFLATSVDSGCYVVSSVATRRLGVNDDPARWHRSFWALAQTLLACGLLSIGGLGVAKQFGNFSGALMALPVVLLAWSWFRIIARDRDLLRKYRVRDDEPVPEEQAVPLAETLASPAAPAPADA